MSLEEDKARTEIVNSIRDLETLKITLPLGNPCLKHVHTNQFLFTELPTNVFKLANMPTLGKALNSTYSRYSGYEVNRWYIEGLTINHDSSGSTMELEVNPFASTLSRFTENKKGFNDTYKQALEEKNNQQNNTTSSKTNTVKKKVKSVNTVKLKKVKGFSKSDQEYIIKKVTEAFMKAKNPKTDLAKAKAIYNYYNDNHVYSYYKCMQKMKAYGFKKTFNSRGLNCGDGAATIVAMMRCAGLSADIMHKSGHFYVRVKCNGKYYYCDQAGAPGCKNKRYLGSKGNDDNVWGGISSSASVVGYRYCW